ncbi:MAG: class I SAM-dependent methyltransferase [Halobacteriovoraceae bacterium]|nr:class I SAM-dependent methyltransferase [Halobacteriovoraceae bacterium]
MTKRSNQLSVEQKHALYESSVQSTTADIEFINKEFMRIRGREAHILREDFGGTGKLACEWTAQSSEHKAFAVDLDPEPISYGRQTHFQQLSKEDQTRMKYIEANVLDSHDFKSDIIVAFNFSYFIFKKRNELLDYFKMVREGLSEEGLFFVDLFGGTECRQELLEETEHEGFSYYWDCDKYNPITSECLYKIHFKKDGVMYHDVFTYDWRFWGLQEIRDIMIDAGFSDTVAYWEGDDEDGSGDGEFYVSDNEENCESWVTYIVGIP